MTSQTRTAAATGTTGSKWNTAIHVDWLGGATSEAASTLKKAATSHTGMASPLHSKIAVHLSRKTVRSVQACPFHQRNRSLDFGSRYQPAGGLDRTYEIMRALVARQECHNCDQPIMSPSRACGAC